MSDIKVFNQQLEKARNIREIAALDFVKDRTIKTYEGIWGRKDGEHWYMAEIQHMLTLFAEKPKLAQCDKMSIWGCLMTAAREGLSIHQGHLDLIPYGNVLKADRNYKGMRHQLRKMPEIKFVGEASLVFKEDEFEYNEKKKEVIKHTRKGAPESMALDKIIAAYVTIEFQDNRSVDVLMWNQEIVAAKNKSKNKADGSVWDQFPWEMAKKTVVKRANKIHYERPQIEVVGFNPIPESKEEEEDTTITPHEIVNEDTGEVTQTEQPQVQQAQPVSSGMDDFLNNK